MYQTPTFYGLLIRLFLAYPYYDIAFFFFTFTFFLEMLNAPLTSSGSWARIHIFNVQCGIYFFFPRACLS